jgi:hypothetical protein
MTQRIYDCKADIRLNPFAGAFSFAIGVVLLLWYLRRVYGAIASDIQSFPAAFRSDAALAALFAALKLLAYILFPILFAAMIYVPVRNLMLRRVVSGRLGDVSVLVVVRGKTKLSVKLDDRMIIVANEEGLEASLEGLRGIEIRFTLGAFDRVLMIERLP